jgi:hypothetical protein
MMIAKRIFIACFLSLAALTGVTCAPQAEPARPISAQGQSAEASPTPVAVPATFKDRIDAALEHVRRRDLYTNNGFWTIFHGILGMGPAQTTLVDPQTNQRYNAVDYIANGLPIRGMVFVPMGDLGLDVQTQAGTGVGQGHQDQFVAEMTQWGMPLDKKFIIAGKEHTFADFVRYSKARTSLTANQELSWAILIVGDHYGTDISWTNQAGEKIAFEDVVRYELNQPIEDAACGGTHRLFGLTWVYHLHLKNGGKNTGVWQEVADKIDFYKKQAHKLQNPDGSFATGYVSTPGNSPDVQLKISTTGHVLEWLALALTKQELSEPWVQDAVNALVMMILESRSDPIEGGALYHAVHGLYIYRARVFGAVAPGLLFPEPAKEG